MNTSESNLLSRKIAGGNPSLKQMWKGVHRVQYLKIFSRLLHVFTFLIIANKECFTSQEEIRSTTLSFTCTLHEIVMKQILVHKPKGSCEHSNQFKK